MSELFELESQNSEPNNADVDVGLFIETIQHYEFLYSKGHKDYKNKPMKDAAWKEIAEIFNGSVEDLMRLWKNLRDRFLKEKNKTKSGSEAPESVWPFFKAMMFYSKFTKTYTVGGLLKTNSKGNSSEGHRHHYPPGLRLKATPYFPQVAACQKGKMCWIWMCLVPLLRHNLLWKHRRPNLDRGKNERPYRVRTRWQSY